jgi:hypothetical protein
MFLAKPLIGFLRWRVGKKFGFTIPGILLFPEIRRVKGKVSLAHFLKMDEMSEDYCDVLTAVQEGEFEVVKEAISGRFVSVHAKDQSGCSLLHWAAINNRVKIARFLIENGLSKCEGGGLLEETPFQWALRKRYYCMMDLLYTHAQCDLDHKSVQGNDALFLACKLGMIL